MKILLFTVLLALLAFSGAAAKVTLFLHDNDKAFIQALIMTESMNDDSAVGDNGKAYGALQIHAKTVTDINKLQRLSLTHNDMFKRNCAIYSCYIYLAYWGKNYTLETGKKPSYQTLARIWNGGPEGYKNSKTKKYWKKVKTHLKKRRLMIKKMNQALAKQQADSQQIVVK